MITAVLLAAGGSTRMRSGHKLLQPFGTATVLATTLAAIAASAASDLVVVLGHEADRIRLSLPASRARFVTAPDHAEGLAGSLRAGLAACAPATEAALVCLGDMPLVRTATLDALLACACGPATIAAPVHGGRRGNPVLWGRAHFAALAALRGDTGGRKLLDAHPVTLVDTDDPGTLLDLDTDEALAAARLLAATSIAAGG